MLKQTLVWDEKKNCLRDKLRYNFQIYTGIYRSNYNGTKITLFGRTPMGRRIVLDILGFRPYFYVQGNGPYSSFDGTSLKRVYTTEPSDIRRLRGNYEHTWEADVPFVRRFLIDSGLDMVYVPPRVLYLDIEAESLDGEIISCSFALGDKLWFVQGRDNVRREIIGLMKKDVFDGYASYYTYDRDALNRIGLFTNKKYFYVDILNLFKKAWVKEGLSDYTLDTVAKRILGRGKIEVKKGEIGKLSYEKLKEYNLRDTELLRDLDKEMGLTKLRSYVSYLNGSLIEDSLTPYRIGDTSVLREAGLRNMVLPTGGNEEEEEYEGAYVYAKSGLYSNVAVFDVACFDKETEILSRDGWKKYNEINIGEDILTFNLDKKVTEFQSIKLINKGHVSNRDLLRIENKNVDCLITKNHRVLFKKRLKRKEFKKKMTDYIVDTARDMPKTYIEIPTSYPIFRERDYPVSDDLIRILGWVVTEGSYNGSGFAISQSENINSENCVEITDTLNNLGWEFVLNRSTNHYRRNGELSWYIRKVYCEDLRIEKNHKTIPIFWLENLSSRQLKILFDTIMKGDGHYNSENSGCIYAKDESMRDRFQWLCTLLGYTCSICKNNLHVFFKKQSSSHICGGKKKDGSKRIRWEKYTGIIWCPTVENGFVVIRRNGKVSITGNSMYPSAVLEKNISFENYLGNGEFDKDVDAIMPHLMRTWLAERKRVGKKTVAGNTYKILANCFSENTDIMTVDGIKNMRDVKIGDLVYTINPQTLELEYKPVIDRFEKYDIIYHVENSRISEEITNDHRFLVHKDQWDKTPEFRELKDFRKREKLPRFPPIEGEKTEIISLFKYITNGVIHIKHENMHLRTFKNILPDALKEKILKYGKYNGNQRTYVLSCDVLTEEDILSIHHLGGMSYHQYTRNAGKYPIVYQMKDIIRLIGWYVTEGSLVYGRENSYYGIQLVQHGKFKKKMKKDIEVFNFSTSNDRVFSISSKLLHDFLRNDCGSCSKSKRLPSWVFELDHTILKLLWNTMMMGDGTLKSKLYTTNSLELTKDFVRLNFHIGRHAYLNNDKSIYRTRTLNNRKHITIKRDLHVKKLKYGKVIGITTKDNHTVIAGCNLKLYPIGQSLYGFSGMSFSRIYNIEVAGAITGTCRDLIKGVSDTLEGKGYEIILVDTDSSYIANVKEGDLDTIQGIIDRYIHDIGYSLFKMEFEGMFDQAYVVKMKHYALRSADGTEKLRGIALRRGDSSKYLKKIYRNALDMIFEGNSKEKVLNTIKGRVNNELTELSLDEICTPKGMNLETKVLTQQQKAYYFSNKYLGYKPELGEKIRVLPVRDIPDKYPRKFEVYDPSSGRMVMRKVEVVALCDHPDMKKFGIDYALLMEKLMRRINTLFPEEEKEVNKQMTLF